MKDKTSVFIISMVLVTLLSVPLLISPSLAGRSEESKAIFYVW